ncbi:MAG: 1-acyl-sn-glycerol-3-phosphate acyltransferase [Gammaproteobacteria bacterium]|nr:1-acyl-sn-glycerol-3-phosphate acyltransferase [Gammaproteobacteria bacterium]
MTLWLTLRSLAFYGGYIVIVGFFSSLAFTVGMLLPQAPRQTLATTANALVVLWLRLCCGVKLRVEGRENIPQRPFVALSKHQSSWETYYLQRLLRPVSTVLKRELLKIPFFGWGLAVVAPIAIDRGNPREALRQVMQQGRERLGAGMNVLLYPEGTRIDVGASAPKFNRSGAALAIAAGVPVLPVCHNAGGCWPAHRFIKYPGTITLVFGKPIDTTGRDAKSITNDVAEWMEKTLAGLTR